jgi:hypothetical protein
VSDDVTVDEPGTPDGHGSTAGTRLGVVFGRRAQRTFLVVGAAAVVVQSAFVATTPAATGYETSVVTAYPTAHWVAVGVAVAAVVLVALGAAIHATGYWRYAAALLAATDGLLVWLPVARGYALYGRGSSDPLFHLSLVREVVATGEVPGTFYPAFHLVAAELVGLGVSLSAVQHVIALTLRLLFVAGVVALVRALLDDPRGYPLGLAAATPLLFGDFHAQLHPAVLSVSFLPVIAAAVEAVRRTDAARHVLVAAAVVATLVFVHPVTTLLAVVLVVTTALGTRLYPLVTGVATRRLRTTVALAVAPAAFAWYLSFGRTQAALVRVAGASVAAPAATQLGRAESASLSTTELAVRFGQLYGPVFVYFLVAGCCCLVVVLAVRRASYPELHLVGQYAVGAGLAVTFLAVYLIASDPLRVSRYLVFVATVIVAVVAGGRLLPTLPPALAVGRPVRRADAAVGSRTRAPARRRRPRTAGGRAALAVVLAAAIVAAAVVGAFAVYEPNRHLTHAEAAGADFALVYADGGTPVRSFGLTMKTQWYVLGERNPEYPRPVFDEGRDGYLPPNLGYDGPETAVDALGRSYVVTQAFDTTWHTAVYYTPAQRAERVHYTDADLARLDADRTADRLYTNGGFDLWSVA